MTVTEVRHSREGRRGEGEGAGERGRGAVVIIIVVVVVVVVVVVGSDGDGDGVVNADVAVVDDVQSVVDIVINDTVVDIVHNAVVNTSSISLR